MTIIDHQVISAALSNLNRLPGAGRDGGYLVEREAVAHMLRGLRDTPPVSEVLRRPFAHAGGHAWMAHVHSPWPSDGLHDHASGLVLMVDGMAMGPAHALHDDIRRLGGGRYSHWGAVLYFSTVDGADPNADGREYAISLEAKA